MFVTDIFSVVLGHWLLYKSGFQHDRWIAGSEQRTRSKK